MYDISNSNFNKAPSIQIPDQYRCSVGWAEIGNKIQERLSEINKDKKILVLECYHGVFEKQIIEQLEFLLKPNGIIHSSEAMCSELQIQEMVFPDVTNDLIFGFMTDLEMAHYFECDKLEILRHKIDECGNGLIIIYGIGASQIWSDSDVLVYADMPRWEIQQRMRRHEVDNIGLNNRTIDPGHLYKHGYFVDWRVCDGLKKKFIKHWDFVVDTTESGAPKMLDGPTYRAILAHTATRPFSLVPFFDPGPWGGQWMKEVCNLGRSKPNYAWCFNCVPEENSLYFQFDKILFETPAINLVFDQALPLLGSSVYERFGVEFPIRFDFLDTMGGGNLSLQVHPITSYIKEHFGMNYTQDESYYFLDAKEGAIAYLGLKENVDQNQMLKELREAQNDKSIFQADQHVETWPVKKHDHLQIPSGTVHCQGKDSMVLEISATPYIFTFKLWDWGRMGLDGKPRPINIDRREEVIQWSRQSTWTNNNLVNQVDFVGEGNGWKEEKIGLHELEFIETRRHWFTQKVYHHTDDTVHVINLVEGSEAIVERPDNAFDPFVIHYAETFIVPAAVGGVYHTAVWAKRREEIGYN